MLLIDSHSHIFSEEFDIDRNNVIARAADAGVRYHIMPNIDSSSTPQLLSTAQQFSQCFPLMGLHPTSVNLEYNKELEHVEQMLHKHKFWGIGEIGIDLYWDNTHIEAQKIAFRHQLRLAKKYNLPVVIHSRNSFNEIFSIVDQEIDSTLKGVFHSFTGTIDQYKHILDYKSFYIGIGGIVTYKNGGIDKLMADMDMQKILLETDSPYLSPVPMRGKRNESYNLIYIATKIADLKGISIQDVAEQTSLNTQKLFNIPIV